jgi:hypothetical protein
MRAAAAAERAARRADVSWSKGMKVQVGGAGTVAHAGVVLPRHLADQVGLSDVLGEVVARAGFVPGRDRGRLLTDLIASLAAGATCLSDVEAMTAQVELFGPGGGASDSTLLRAVEEYAGTVGADGLPGRKAARGIARVRDRAWRAVEDRPATAERPAGLPAVTVAGADLRRRGVDEDGVYAEVGRPVLVLRIDATLVEAASGKDQAAGHYKGGYGFHPMGGWCSNTGEALAVMLRPGNAGSFTGADQVKVLTAAFAQVPARWRRDVLVTIDGAGASHEVIDHLDGLNTHREHGRRGRRAEYSIGWPLDERTTGAIDRLAATAWSEALTAEGKVDSDAQVAELTGILRPAGALPDELEGWPADLRVIARRTKRPEGKPAKLGQDVDFEYGVFVTNTVGGQVQHLDARHRTQAHVEDGVKQTKACGARMLPSKNYQRNAAWLQLAALAQALTCWLRLIALDGDLAKASVKTLRYRIYSAPARLVHRSRYRILKVPPGWAWSTDVTAAWARVTALAA